MVVDIRFFRGESAVGALEQVMNFLIDNEPHFTVEYGRTGKPKPYCYDQADSLIIARAGFECLKEKLE